MSAMNMDGATRPVDEDIAQAASQCRQAMAESFADLPLPPAVPHRPDQWFALLRSCPTPQATARAIHPLQAATAWPPGTVEHLALLQCAIAAAPVVPTLQIDDAVKRLFATILRQLAVPPRSWAGQFDATASSFWEMTMLLTLRRFPAGELVFDVTRLPGSWLLKINPLELPRLLHGLASRIGGNGPFFSPHLNYWRPNRLQLIKTENERSLWRIARSAARQPSIRGLMADGWFYSAEVGEAFPHLSWLRNFFVEQGAIIVDMEPAQADSGLMVGSARRRQLYAEGSFRPRRTLILWPRADMLAWAEHHPELGESAQAADWRGAGAAAAAPRPVRRPGRKRRPLWNAVDVINRRPKVYFAASVLFPAMAVAAAAGLSSAWWATIPAFGLAGLLFWSLQYLLFQ